FPEIFINMIETGETGGVLEPVLEQLSIHFEREHEIYEKVKSGMTYPLVILIIAICAISFMLIFILPKFVGIILGTGAVLPLPTKIVLALSDILRRFWWVFLLAIGCGSIVFTKIMQLPSWRKKIDYFFLTAPIFGKIVQKMVAARFARSLSIMLKCGVPIIEALNTLERTIGNLVIANAVANARQNIVLGKGISQPLAATGVFPLMVVQMISVGEETGTLGVLLEKVAIFYEKEVDYTLSRLSTLVEPVMIVGLGIVLGFIIIAIMMPMFTIVTTAPM
ncbi:MAG: type II secretion system F family protein, partial [Desulfitobacteriaceae bacterium]|nr:type II secretion system F family protein [Desulfitobacteriaceae bacterium]